MAKLRAHEFLHVQEHIRSEAAAASAYRQIIVGLRAANAAIDSSRHSPCAVRHFQKRCF